MVAVHDFCWAIRAFDSLKTSEVFKTSEVYYLLN